MALGLPFFGTSSKPKAPSGSPPIPIYGVGANSRPSTPTTYNPYSHPDAATALAADERRRSGWVDEYGNIGPHVAEIDPRKQQLRTLTDIFMSQQAADQARYQNRIGELEGAYGAVAGAARKGADLELRGVDLDEKDLGIERGALDRQTPLLDQLFGLREGQRGSEREYLKTLDKLGEDTLANQLLGAGYKRDRSRDAAYGDAAARGATTTIGSTRAQQQIAQDYDLNVSNYKIERQRDAAGIKARWDDNYWQGEIDKAQTAEDKAKIQDRYKTLDVMAERLGLRREQIANSLAQSLASMNLNKVVSVGQVLDAMNSNNMKLTETFLGVLGQTIEAEGLL